MCWVVFGLGWVVLGCIFYNQFYCGVGWGGVSYSVFVGWLVGWGMSESMWDVGCGGVLQCICLLVCLGLVGWVGVGSLCLFAINKKCAFLYLYV